MRKRTEERLQPRLGRPRRGRPQAVMSSLSHHVVVVWDCEFYDNTTCRIYTTYYLNDPRDNGYYTMPPPR